jgi:hypothetical protein
MAFFRRRGGRERRPAVRWVPVAWPSHQPEAEMLAGLLAQAQIPAFIRRSQGVDVPDMLAGGPRVLLVPEELMLEARAILDPYEPIEDADLPPDPPGPDAPDTPQ